MSGSVFPELLDELGKMLERIPIVDDIPSNGRFMDGVSIDTQIPFEKESAARLIGISKNSVSFRDIVRLFSMFLREHLGVEGRSAGWQEIIHQYRYKQLREIGCAYPVNYLLFDFCLAALDGDHVDARLYLAHSLHILGLHSSLNLLLSVIVNEKLTQDGDVRDLLTLLARVTEPRNARNYIETFGPEFKRRYDIYIRECKRLE
jgi:hypothetical protein